MLLSSCKNLPLLNLQQVDETISTGEAVSSPNPIYFEIIKIIKVIIKE